MKDFSYYLEGLDISFSFIGLSETWATKTNEDILNMLGYNHEHCIQVSKKGGCSTTMSGVDFERRLEGGRGVEIWVMELWGVFHSSLLNP